jgi:hypothetical protein
MAQGVHRVNVTGLNMGHVGVGNPGFGADVTRRFCANEGLQMVIRSHQVVPEGAKFMHGGHLVTVFSARNYVDPQRHNDSALLLLAYDEQGHLLVRTKRLAHRIEEKIEKGGMYWYRDRMDGVEKQVEVVSVDRSISPPSYVIRFEGRERETEGTLLSLHPRAGEVGVSVVVPQAQSVVPTVEEPKGPRAKIGGLSEMLTRLDLADRYLQKLECEEIDIGTLQETLAIGGRPALLQSLESAGVDKAGPRDKIANYLQQSSSA